MPLVAAVGERSIERRLVVEGILRVRRCFLPVLLIFLAVAVTVVLFGWQRSYDGFAQGSEAMWFDSDG